MAGDPTGHVMHGRRFAGRIVVREGFAEPLDVPLHHALAARIAALAGFLEQAAGNGAAFRPSLMEVGFVGVEDAGPARPPSDQELVRGDRIGEAADSVAGQAQSAGDQPQAEPLIQQGVDGRVLLAHPVGQTARLPWFIWVSVGRGDHSGAKPQDTAKHSPTLPPVMISSATKRNRSAPGDHYRELPRRAPPHRRHRPGGSTPRARRPSGRPWQRHHVIDRRTVSTRTGAPGST